MKKLVLLLLFVFISFGGAIYAQNNKSNDTSTEITLKNNLGKAQKGGVKRSSAQRIVSASICNNILTINFISSTPNATITISNEQTGEIVYTEVCNAGSTTIDLSTFLEESNNTYTISISTPSWERYGEFNY